MVWRNAVAVTARRHRPRVALSIFASLRTCVSNARDAAFYRSDRVDAEPPAERVARAL